MTDLCREAEFSGLHETWYENAIQFLLGAGTHALAGVPLLRCETAGTVEQGKG